MVNLGLHHPHGLRAREQLPQVVDGGALGTAREQHGLGTDLAGFLLGVLPFA